MPIPFSPSIPSIPPSSSNLYLFCNHLLLQMAWHDHFLCDSVNFPLCLFKIKKISNNFMTITKSMAMCFAPIVVDGVCVGKEEEEEVWGLKRRKRNFAMTSSTYGRSEFLVYLLIYGRNRFKYNQKHLKAERLPLIW